MSDAEIFVMIRDWFKSIRISSWFLLFGFLNLSILFIQLLSVAFGYEFVKETEYLKHFGALGSIFVIMGFVTRVLDLD